MCIEMSEPIRPNRYITTNWQLQRRVLSRSLSCRIIAQLLSTWTVKISSSESWVQDEPDFKFQVSLKVLLLFLLHYCRNRIPYLLNMAHSTNSFTINIAPGSKEFMLLDKLATTNFKPDAQYNLELANSDILVDAIDCNSKQYAYNLSIAHVPT